MKTFKRNDDLTTYDRGEKLKKDHLINAMSLPLDKIGRLSVLYQRINRKLDVGTLVYEVLKKPEDPRMATICFFRGKGKITDIIRESDVKLAYMQIEKKKLIPIHEEYILENIYGCLNYKDGKVVGRANWVLLAATDAIGLSLLLPVTISSIALFSTATGSSQAKTIAEAVSILNAYKTSNIPMAQRTRALTEAQLKAMDKAFQDAAIFFFPICRDL